jgi:hypothetical protein
MFLSLAGRLACCVHFVDTCNVFVLLSNYSKRFGFLLSTLKEFYDDE